MRRAYNSGVAQPRLQEAVPEQSRAGEEDHSRQGAREGQEVYNPGEVEPHLGGEVYAERQ